MSKQIGEGMVKGQGSFKSAEINAVEGARVDPDCSRALDCALREHGLGKRRLSAPGWAEQSKQGVRGLCACKACQVLLARQMYASHRVANKVCFASRARVQLGPVSLVVGIISESNVFPQAAGELL